MTRERDDDSTANERLRTVNSLLFGRVAPVPALHGNVDDSLSNAGTDVPRQRERAPEFRLLRSRSSLDVQQDELGSDPTRRPSSSSNRGGESFRRITRAYPTTDGDGWSSTDEVDDMLREPDSSSDVAEEIPKVEANREARRVQPHAELDRAHDGRMSPPEAPRLHTQQQGYASADEAYVEDNRMTYTTRSPTLHSRPQLNLNGEVDGESDVDRLDSCSALGSDPPLRWFHNPHGYFADGRTLAFALSREPDAASAVQQMANSLDHVLREHPRDLWGLSNAIEVLQVDGTWMQGQTDASEHAGVLARLANTQSPLSVESSAEAHNTFQHSSVPAFDAPQQTPSWTGPIGVCSELEDAVAEQAVHQKFEEHQAFAYPFNNTGSAEAERSWRLCAGASVRVLAPETVAKTRELASHLRTRGAGETGGWMLYCMGHYASCSTETLSAAVEFLERPDADPSRQLCMHVYREVQICVFSACSGVLVRQDDEGRPCDTLALRINKSARQAYSTAPACSPRSPNAPAFTRQPSPSPEAQFYSDLPNGRGYFPPTADGEDCVLHTSMTNEQPSDISGDQQQLSVRGDGHVVSNADMRDVNEEASSETAQAIGSPKLRGDHELVSSGDIEFAHGADARDTASLEDLGVEFSEHDSGLDDHVQEDDIQDNSMPEDDELGGDGLDDGRLDPNELDNNGQDGDLPPDDLLTAADWNTTS